MRRLRNDVPRWSIFLHREARGLAQVDADDSAMRRLEDELFERLYGGEAEPLPEAEIDPELGAWAKKIHDTCDQLPQFSRLSAESRGDPDAAAAGVEALMEELSPLLTAQPNADKAPDLRRSIRAGADKASAIIEASREAAEGLAHVAFGSGPGPAGVTPGAPSIRALARRLREDTRLRRIALLAGRFRRIGAAKRRQRVRHGADEVSNVEQGADLARLLPVELGRLIQPRLRLAALRDLTERRCLQYALTGMEALGRGPLVVALDKSGSMAGEPDTWATAVALALLGQAQQEKRPFALLGFDDNVKYEVIVQPSDCLPEEGLFIGCGGGTSIANVLGRGVQIIARHPGALRQADIVLITDGGSDPSRASDLRCQAESLGATVLGIGIGVGTDVLQPWCDHIEVVSDLQNMDDRTADALFAR